MREIRTGRLSAVFAPAVVVVLAVAGCTIGSHAQATGPNTGGGTGGTLVVPGQPSALRWHACGARTQCAAISVPLDYSHPAGRKITLALTEVPATAPPGQRLGILLVNPGGPGGSGLSMASFVAQGLTPAVAARYDIIGFDPRGVGSSVPALSCDPGFFARERPNYIPSSAAAEQVLVGRARAYAAGCERRFGWLLPYLTTANVARDMDQIRAAAGQAKLSFFGYSYGTYIGQVYATLFPHRVYRMVLDSVVDPTGVWYADNIAQDYAFQGRMRAFFAWVARYRGLYHLGSTPAQVSRSWYTARAGVAAHPVSEPPGPSIGPDEYDDTFLTGGYDNGYWPAMAAALASYLNAGSASQLVTLFNQTGKQSENEFAVYNAVECADVAWPRDWARWNSDARRVYAAAPFEAWDNTWFNAACAFWPVHGPATPMHIGAPGLPGILMLQGTLDAATPYAGAQNARRMLPTARMVVVPGGGNHGQSLAYPASTCVDGYLNRYLATGQLPRGSGLVSAVCPALPDPVPGLARWRVVRSAPNYCVASRYSVRVLRTRAGHSSALRLLTDRDRDEAIALCDRDPVANVFVGARIRSAGLDPIRLGAQIWGYQEAGRLVSLCYVGANMVPVQAAPAAITEFAQRARRQGRRCSSIAGPADAVRDLWNQLAPYWDRPREIRDTQPLMAIASDPLVDPDPMVRLVRPAEFDTLLPASIAMFTEEVGVSPVGADGGASYRARVSELITARRSFARIEDGVVVFKAEVGAVTPLACQVQGVWVPPAMRGRGHASHGMAAVVAYARRVLAPVVSLYVNDFNAPARAAYQRVGFEQVGTFCSVLF